MLCVYGLFRLRQDLWLFLAVFYTWVAISNQLHHFTPTQSCIEAGVFFALVYWLNKRPLWIPSDPKSETLQFAFYRGLQIEFCRPIRLPLA